MTHDAVIGRSLSGVRLSGRAERTPSSGIRDIVHRVLELQHQGHDIIRLEVGESQLNTPEWIIEAAHQDARAGQTRYTASVGQLELREAIAAKLERVNRIRATADNIVVTVGAVQGLSVALAALCEPGDEILIPDPAWPNYVMMAAMIGVETRGYQCRPERGFLPILEEIEAAIGTRTRVIVLNSPNNPAGAVYPSELVRGVLALAERRDVVVLSDEAYDEVYYGDPPVSPGSFVPVESGRWVAVFSFSKTYAMTGWRVGYLVGPKTMTGSLTRLQEATVSCVSSIDQRGALAALNGPQTFVASQRDELRRRRDGVLAQLRRSGRTTSVPQGAFYVLVDVGPHDDHAFALQLIDSHGVSVAPGSAFGPGGRGYIRLCYAAGGDRLSEAVDRLIGALA